ncbi:MAG: Lrp/AsnC family transcriptional regulator [Ruminococcaceae bacterium]|nr:Lrp/AsnC family transcriptional regulator [Oscillospiraceae bacterium]
MTQIKKAEKLIDVLHKNCKLSLEQVAAIAEMTVPEAAAAIEALEKEGVIMGYGAVINWDKLPSAKDKVTAYIELKVTPQRHNGFNRLAQQIYQFPQVKSMNLMSGSYDFGVTVEGESIKDISLFVSEHLATMESVLSTATHFVLKRYKDDGVVFSSEKEDDREVISL